MNGSTVFPSNSKCFGGLKFFYQAKPLSLFFALAFAPTVSFGQSVLQQVANVVNPIPIPLPVPPVVVQAVRTLNDQVTDRIAAANAHVTGEIAAANAHVTGQIAAANAHVTGQIAAANAHVTGQIAAANAHATGELASGNKAIAEAAAAGNRDATDYLARRNAEVTKGVQHTAEQAKELNKNAKVAIEKGGRDTEAEVGRFGKSVEDAAHAIGHFVELEAQGTGASLSNAEKRIREGKVVDALWHLATERYQHTSENAAIAVQESEYLNTVASVAATAYGGPQGAAAYAAWLTYNQTGNADLAFRAGILAFVTSSAMADAGNMKIDTGLQVAQKAAVVASIGGLAVAAAGGSVETIQEGFFRAGAMVLVQDGYKSYTGSALDGKASVGDAYCMTEVNLQCSPPDDVFRKDANGKVIIDPKSNKPELTGDLRALDYRRPHVGLMGPAGDSSVLGEQGKPMIVVSKIPGMNAMALFHDEWMIKWHANIVTTVTTIAPAIVLTYAGTGAEYQETLRRAVVNQAKSNDQSAVASPNASQVSAIAEAKAQVTTTPVLLTPAAVTEAPFPQAKNVTIPVIKTAFETTSSVLNVTCASESSSRTVVVDVPKTAAPECRVTVLNSSGVRVSQDKGMTTETCLGIADALTRQWIATGDKCFAKDTSERLGGRPAPVPVLAAVEVRRNVMERSRGNAWIGGLFLFTLIATAAGLGYGAATMRQTILRKKSVPKNA